MNTTKSYSLTLLPDHVVLGDLRSIVSKHHQTTAEMLAHLAEVADRRLWAGEGFSSMYDFCVHGLHMSEDAALKRIQAAKAAQEFPAILPLVAQGRLHLSAVCMLAPHLTPENAAGLLAAATHQSKSAIALVLAAWFPRPAVPTSVRELGSGEHAPGHTGSPADPVPGEPIGSLLPEHAPGHVDESVPPPRLAPLSAEQYEVRFTFSRQAHEKLRYAQSLLARSVPAGDIPALLELALDALIKAGEKQAFSAASRPRRQKAMPKSRHVPAQVQREVWERDHGRCAFVSESGRCCEAKRYLEFDHIRAVADGGKSTAENVRLLCRAHNQLEAERRFGKGFMQRKRQEARASAAPGEHAPGHTAIQAQRAEIVPYLRQLGFKEQQARHGAGLCDHLLGQPLGVLVKHALQQLGRARFERCTARPDAA